MITDPFDGLDAFCPDVGSGHVVWLEPVFGGGGVPVSHNLVVFSRAMDGIVKRITVASRKGCPAISGLRVVWADNRSGNFDIYMLDLNTMIEQAIVTGPAVQTEPATDGGRVVWRDHRNGNGDIYMLDLSSMTETQITSNSALQFEPAISGTVIVWTDRRNGNDDIYMARIP